MMMSRTIGQSISQKCTQPVVLPRLYGVKSKERWKHPSSEIGASSLKAALMDIRLWSWCAFRIEGEDEWYWGHLWQMSKSHVRLGKGPENSQYNFWLLPFPILQLKCVVVCCWLSRRENEDLISSLLPICLSPHRSAPMSLFTVWVHEAVASGKDRAARWVGGEQLKNGR